MKPQEHVSKDLEEAATNYADNEEYGDDVWYAIKAAYKEGANWHKEQMKGAVDAVLVDNIDGTQDICLHTNRYGDKVKVIIVKGE